MASSKRTLDPSQMGLVLPVAQAVASSEPLPIPRVELDLFELDDFDDYSEDAPRIELVDPPKLVNVIVENCGSHFEVSRLRDNGTTVACVMWARDELVELIKRAEAALET